MLERISKLDKYIQEYISLGIKVGLFNDNNLDRVVSRLERVRFSSNNYLSGDAHSNPIRDQNNVRKSYGIDVQINEKKTKNSGKYYFEDEVVFHELTHCINGIYENWFENLSLWFDFDKILKKNFNVEDDAIEQLSSNAQYRQKAYAWEVLDEFVAQYVAQMLVNAKYGKNVYRFENKVIRQSDPLLSVYTDFNDYHEFYEIVLNFIKPIYGNDVNRFISDSLDDTVINKIFSSYVGKNNGFNSLYCILGEMGNIGFAVASRNFTKEQCATDRDMIARNPKNFFKHYNNCLSLIDDVLHENLVIPGVAGHFGNSSN